MAAGLKEIPTELIHVGFRLPGAILDRKGRSLLPAGRTLTATDILGLGTRVITGLFGGDDWPDDLRSIPAAKPPPQCEPAQPPVAQPAGPPPHDSGQTLSATSMRRVSVSTLRVGMSLSCDIYDEHGVLSLAAGSRITERYLHLLKMRRIRFVQLQPPSSPPPAPMYEGDAVDEPPVRPADDQARLTLNELWHEAQAGLAQHATASRTLADVCTALSRGGSVDGEQMLEIVDGFFDRLTLDSDLLATIVSLQRSLGEYLFDHSVNVALLSMSIGAQLGMSRDQVHAMGLGAVFQDLGMMRIPESIRLAPRELSPEEHAEIRRHPIYTLELLERMRSIPREAGFISYQTHEREDRSGYPRNRSTTTIHPFAKIVAVADSFAAMIRSRPHRPPLIPHLAIKQLLVDGRNGRFDRKVIRALLDSVSAFPIGSEVELSSGVRAIVLRPNPGLHTQPVVAPIGPDGVPSSTVIDLATETDVKVHRAFHIAERSNKPQIIVAR